MLARAAARARLGPARAQPSRWFCSSEVGAARAAAGNAGEPTTVFDKILSKQTPAEIVHEDELCLAFADVAPQAPTHLLVIPKVRAGLTSICNATPEHASVLGHMMVQAGKLGAKLCPDGFRLVVNDGADGAQSVHHLHIHVLGGRQMGWPPG